MLARVHDMELDGGPKNLGAATERYCVATRAVRPVDELIRFVIGPDGQLVPDLKRKLPGRGVWVTGTRTVLAEAVRRKAFTRGFKREVRVPPDLVARTEQMLERSALDALAIAGKAGQVVAGFAKVEAAILDGHIRCLMHAADAAPDGVRKIDASLRRNAPDTHRIAVIDAFTSAQLDLALARPNVIHAALLAGPASATFLARSARLERFRTGCPAIQAKATRRHIDKPED
jgi:predicted RNA-binding protein YlxR (DUF448 family)